MFDRKLAALITVFALSLCTAIAPAAMIRVTVENMAPENGTFVTPVWVGFHDGAFDLYDVGSAASAGLEAIAEGGDVSGLNAELAAATPGAVSGVVNGAPIAPNSGGFTATFDVSPPNRWLSFATMVVPSNDAFVGNGDAIEVLDGAGNIIPGHWLILGADVLDAGTEANTEGFDDAAGPGGYTNANSPAEDDDATVHTHPGFLPVGTGTILDNPNVDLSNADFAALFAGDYPVLRVQIVPEPATMAILAAGACLPMLRRRR